MSARHRARTPAHRPRNQRGPHDHDQDYSHNHNHDHAAPSGGGHRRQRTREGRFAPTVRDWFVSVAGLAAADAFVVITPEYNHSFPADLKHAIDWHLDEWRAKPVGFVSYGGVAGGLRAVEQLRLVFAELHAPTMRDTVSFHGAWHRFGPDGQPHDAEGPAGAAKVMLDQLAWWAVTLRDGKAARAYTA
ncbi:hypothetical protein GCM10009837_82470 [Streptomyces durmitorensis]